jgi:hypothetical protein
MFTKKTATWGDHSNALLISASTTSSAQGTSLTAREAPTTPSGFWSTDQFAERRKHLSLCALRGRGA